MHFQFATNSSIPGGMDYREHSGTDQTGALVAILRDRQGGFVAATTAYLPQVSSVAMAEALALLNVLSFAQSLGYQAIEAESESARSHPREGQNLE
jgi:hypothetical protein